MFLIVEAIAIFLVLFTGHHLFRHLHNYTVNLVIYYLSQYEED